MKKVVRIIQKDIKLLLRSKVSSLIIIFGPLLIMFLVGVAFDNSNQYSVNIGVHSESYSELTNSFIDKLVEQKFSVSLIDDNETCLQHIKEGIIHTCIIFPPKMEISPDKVNEIIFYADYSKINLVWMIVDTLSSGLSDTSREISTDLTQTLLNKLQDTKEEVAEDMKLTANIKDYSSFMEDKMVKISDDAVVLIESIDYDDLHDKNDELKEVVTSFRSDAKNRIDDMKTHVSYVRGASGAEGNVSDDELKIIQDSLNIIEGELNALDYRLNKSEDNAEAAWKELKDSLIVVRRNYDTIKKTIRDNSDEINGLLATANDDLTKLSDSLNSIHSSIGGVQITDADKIVSPIQTKIRPLVSEKTHLNYVFSGLLVLVIMFVSILLSTTIVMMEKTSPSYFRNFITPTKDIIFVLSSYLTTLFVMAIQLVVILIISAAFFNAPIAANIGAVLLMLLLVTTVFTLIGMFVGHSFSSQETATIASISIGSIFLLLSNMILPLESMPTYVREIAKFNPFVISENILKKTILFSTELKLLLNEIYLLLAYSLVLFVLIYYSQKAIKRHYWKRFMYKRSHKVRISTVVKLIRKGAKSLKKGRNEEAYKYYIEARDIYEKLKKQKKKIPPKLFEKLKALHSALGGKK